MYTFTHIGLFLPKLVRRNTFNWIQIFDRVLYFSTHENVFGHGLLLREKDSLCWFDKPKILVKKESQEAKPDKRRKKELRFQKIEACEIKSITNTFSLLVAVAEYCTTQESENASYLKDKYNAIFLSVHKVDSHEKIILRINS